MTTATLAGSEPIVGLGPVQPSVVRRKNGELIAYLRDNGPPPKRIMQSVLEGRRHEAGLPQPTSTSPIPARALMKRLRSPMAAGSSSTTTPSAARNSLAISLSDDEGQTWKWTRHIEKAAAGSFHYPSVIQSRDGAIHVTYSRYTGAKPEMQAITHARFSADWIVAH